MSNIDFSKIMTTQDRAARDAAIYAASVKADCKEKILARFPEVAQQNIGQAVTTYVAGIVQGGDQKDAEAQSGLGADDITLAAEGRQWIVAMQAACRAKISTQEDHVDWPVFPNGLSDLISRF